MFQYRKRYGLHAIPASGDVARCATEEFQYRKRYGLHAMTALLIRKELVAMFQYRKRYGLHAIRNADGVHSGNIRFNTASGMDCMQ